jgi:predicted phage-related endonuclease
MLLPMTDNDDNAVLDDDDLALVENLREVREDIKKLTSREDAIRSALLDRLQGIEYGLTADGSPVIEVQRQPRSRVDSKRLQALYEEVWEDCQIKSEVEVLRFPETATAE